MCTAGLSVEALHDDPQHVGLQSPTQCKFTLINFASTCHHAVGLDNKALVAQPVNPKDHSDMQEMLLELVGAFFKDFA